MIVILDNIRSALNVGSIIRTCDAFGIKELYFCGLTPGLDSPKVQKTALGAQETINDIYFRSTIEAVHAAKDDGFEIISLEVDTAATEISSFTKGPRKIALVVGNEVSGVANEVLAESDHVIQIPMRGDKESLNVAVAFGIAAFILSR